MIEYIDIDKLNPADYNPRCLSDDALAELKNSITELGVIKPIIIRRSDFRIMAGHQRTKTMKLLGYTQVPAFILDGVNSTDEVRFNQLHNFVECEVHDAQPLLTITPDSIQGTGFQVIKNSDIHLHNKGTKNTFVVELTKMVIRYGQFANAICDSAGNILVSCVYAKAIKLLGMDLLVYVLPEGMEERARYFFGKQYGVFEYSHIEKKTYIQSFAQKPRLRSKNGVMASRTHSVLYETQVIPIIDKSMRILDFGAGQKDYAIYLRKKGYKIDAIEFFHRQDNVDAIDEKEIRDDNARICRTLETYGQYDVIVCDSVLNSVNSLQDEKNVLLSLAALCKKGGLIFWSGIPLQFRQKTSDRKNSMDYRTVSIFLDKNGFTANLRYGEWYFQKYHSMENIRELNTKYIGSNFKVYENGRLIPEDGEVKASSFQVVSINDKAASLEEMEEALRYEFSLPLPRGKRWNLDKDLIPAYLKSLK